MQVVVEVAISAVLLDEEGNDIEPDSSNDPKGNKKKLMRAIEHAVFDAVKKQEEAGFNYPLGVDASATVQWVSSR